MSTSRIDVVYDGGCGFCVRALAAVRTLDSRGALLLHDARDRPAIMVRFPSLREADLDDAMFVVANDGIYRGFFAFRRLAWMGPLAWPFLLAFYFPGASWLGPRVYAWIAANRRRLGCRSAVCELPPGPKS